MHIVQDLDGANILRGVAEAGKPESCYITILCASGFTTPGGQYFPAESITVSGLDGLIELRTALDDLITEARSGS